MARAAPPQRNAYDEAIELVYYTHRELVGEPDRLLARRGLGRVHHRILYCVARAPGITVGGLCRVLGVTKQAVHQPLATLIREGLIARSTDQTNRRIRRLQLTAAGLRLEQRLAAVQWQRFDAAFREAGPSAVASWRAVMRLLVGATASTRSTRSKTQSRNVETPTR